MSKNAINGLMNGLLLFGIEGLTGAKYQDDFSLTKKIMIRIYYMADDSGGGEGEKPLPVKKTNLSPQQRRDWNDFLDAMQRDGVAGSKDLDQTG